MPASVMPAANEPPVLSSVRRLMRRSQSPVMATVVLLWVGGEHAESPPRRRRAETPEGGSRHPWLGPGGS